MKKIQNIFLFLIMVAISSSTILSMEKVSALTPTIFMQDTTSSAGLSTYSGRQIHAEYVGTSSVLVGKQIDTIVLKLKKETLQTTGNIQIGVFNSDLSVKKLFGTMDATALLTTKTYQVYTFSLPAGQTFQINAGDRIGIKFAVGDSLNHVSIMTDRTNAFDGTNSYRTYYTTAWNNVQGEDLYMTLELVNAQPIPGPISSSDTIPPVIHLLGSSPLTIQQGSTYADAGATATDNVDGTITSSIITSNPVNTAVPGTYTITYNVSDKAGNAALQITRTVIVVSAGGTIPPQTNIRVDPFGVQELFAQKTGKQQIVMGTGNPNSIAGFRLDGGSSATPQTQGQFHYYSILPRSGGLASGGTELTMRINLNPQLSTGTTLPWQQAEMVGYQTSPNDIDEFEQTGYFRISNTVAANHISFKVGGEHTSSNGNLAGTFGMDINFNGIYGGGSSGATSEKELTYPKYEFFTDPQAFKTGDITNKWIGIKVISMHVPTPQVGLCTSANPCQGELYKTYLDLNPIDFTTGAPKNNWQFFTSHLDNGKETGIYSGHIADWGMKFFQFRVNQAQNIDFALLSVHHIDTTTGQSIP